MQKTIAARLTPVVLLGALLLTGCQNAPADAKGNLGQKQSADAAADEQGRPEQKAAFVPVLQQYHDKVSWPAGRDLSAEQMWEKIAPFVGQIALDDSAAKAHVGVLNQCAWSMEAIDAVTAGKDTKAARDGLEQSTALIPESRSLVQKMTQEIELDSIETPRQYVTANECTDDFGS